MTSNDLTEQLRRRILKMIDRDGIPLTEISRAIGIPIATLVYCQKQAGQNSSDSPQS